MQVFNWKFKADRAEGLEYHIAPSLTSAIREDAKAIVKLCIENDLEGSKDALSKYLLGPVSVDIDKVGNVWIVEYYYKEGILPFATVVVE